jgi:transposase-like protein
LKVRKCPHCKKEITKQKPGRPRVSNETEIIGALKQGHSVRRVAKQFGVSPTAVAQAKKRVLKNEAEKN